MYIITKNFTTVNGVSGMKFTSKKEGYTDKYIFIPASGYAKNGSVENRGSHGNIWSSSLDPGNYSVNPYYAWSLNFSSSYNGVYDYYRFYGYSVRGVVSKN